MSFSNVFHVLCRSRVLKVRQCSLSLSLSPSPHISTQMRGGRGTKTIKNHEFLYQVHQVCTNCWLSIHRDRFISPSIFRSKSRALVGHEAHRAHDEQDPAQFVDPTGGHGPVDEGLAARIQRQGIQEGGETGGRTRAAVRPVWKTCAKSEKGRLTKERSTQVCQLGIQRN